MDSEYLLIDRVENSLVGFLLSISPSNGTTLTVTRTRQGGVTLLTPDILVDGDPVYPYDIINVVCVGGIAVVTGAVALGSGNYRVFDITVVQS